MARGYLSATIDIELVLHLSKLAAIQGRSVSSLVEQAVRRLLEESANDEAVSNAGRAGRSG